MLVSILQNLLDSWANFEVLSLAHASSLTVKTVKQFEDFASSLLSTTHSNAATDKGTHFALNNGTLSLFF